MTMSPKPIPFNGTIYGKTALFALNDTEGNAFEVELRYPVTCAHAIQVIGFLQESGNSGRRTPGVYRILGNVSFTYDGAHPMSYDTPFNPRYVATYTFKETATRYCGRYSTKGRDATELGAKLLARIANRKTLMLKENAD